MSAVSPITEASRRQRGPVDTAVGATPDAIDTPIDAAHGFTMTITGSIQARWGHRVDGLIHTHAWTVSATVEGDPDCDKIYPADDLEGVMHDIVERWRGCYLTVEDVGEWKGYRALVWDREPTVEEIVRQLWRELEVHLPGLIAVSLEEASEFDRCRIVRLTRRR